MPVDFSAHLLPKVEYLKTDSVHLLSEDRTADPESASLGRKVKTNTINCNEAPGMSYFGELEICFFEMKFTPFKANVMCTIHINY